MPTFPQLRSGSGAQFPIRKRRVTRTIINECGDGRVLKLSDPNASRMVWDMQFRELTTEEMEAIRCLFEAVEGRMNCFTFVDPMDNLLSWSEDPEQPVWDKGPLLQVTTGISDPFHGVSAFRLANAAGGPVEFRQHLQLPDPLTCCFSLWARSDTSCTIDLSRGAERLTCAAGGVWRRLAHSTTSGGASFAVEIGPGSSVDLFGLQVEAQPGPSAYKKTMANNGLYRTARFDSDVLEVMATAPDRFACTLRISARPE
jgi:hypothetical protein